MSPGINEKSTVLFIKMAKREKEQLNLDAMRPAMSISVPIERNRKERTQFRKGKKSPKREKKAKREEATAKGRKTDIDAWISKRGRHLLVLFSHFQHTV